MDSGGICFRLELTEIFYAVHTLVLFYGILIGFEIRVTDALINTMTNLVAATTPSFFIVYHLLINHDHLFIE
jgi:hypothetical protein